MNRFPLASSCIGPSKSTATSSQQCSQLGRTATANCFAGRCRPLMHTKHLLANCSKSAGMVSHQQIRLSRASILAPLRCAPKMPV